ncbi:MAG: hypothetical protein N2116_00275 [Armatimonadetes bacterium]|nr:hypothetical protein [Armatimonadota bacterium]
MAFALKLLTLHGIATVQLAVGATQLAPGDEVIAALIANIASRTNCQGRDKTLFSPKLTVRGETLTP